MHSVHYHVYLNILVYIALTIPTVCDAPRWPSSLTTGSKKIQESSSSTAVLRQFLVQFGLSGSWIYPFSSPHSSSMGIQGEGVKDMEIFINVCWKQSLINSVYLLLSHLVLTFNFLKATGWTENRKISFSWWILKTSCTCLDRSST